MESDRLAYDKPVCYNNGVKVGFWCEEQKNYKKHCFKHTTTYANDYTPKPLNPREDNLIWDIKLLSEGHDPRLIFDHEGNKYVNNFSSTYDLSYNHLPKCSKEPIHRQWKFCNQKYEPEVDLTRNFGSITKYGLVDYKKEIWQCDKSKRTPLTHYQENFLPPEIDDYKFKRHGIPIENSSIMIKSTSEMMSLKLRDQPIIFVTEPANLVIVPQEPRCNPITWECPDSLKIPSRCIPTKPS